MMLHIGLIIALSCITVALEFMREPEINEILKNIFLVVAFLGYYLFLLLIGSYAKTGYRADGKYRAMLGAAAAAFAICMALGYRSGYISIACRSCLCMRYSA